jgi:demethylmenaquinone methyltransferase/2-methoxy-6-polyprenyl-1,4-benzoquinol methylase
MSNAEDRPGDVRAQLEVAAYYADPVQRLAFMRALFNRSARYYDLVNLLVSLGSGAWYRRFCLRRAGLGSGKIVVDIATGTGLLAREALRLTGKTGMVIGVDVSEAMLAIAQRNLGIPLIQASAEALPLGPGIADFVTMSYALRHVADLETAFAEAKRILRPGGTMLLLEVSAPRNRILRALAAGFIGFLIPRLSQLTARDVRARNLMQYHWQTILSYMPPDVVMRVMRESGFARVTCTSYIDLFHYYIGHNPETEAE